MRYQFIVVVCLLSFASVTAAQQKHSIPAGSDIFIESMDNNFDKTLAAAFIKREVPLAIVTDQTMADYDLSGTTTEIRHSNKSKIAAIALGGVIGAAATADHMKGSFQVTDLKTSQVVYGYNVEKGDSRQSLAEACAKHIKNDAIAKRSAALPKCRSVNGPGLIPTPICGI
jgi:hypothetical protein